MKYNSLKRQTVKSFKIPKLDGGVNFKNPSFKIEDNQLSQAQNVWFKESSLQTRPGFLGNSEQAVKTEIYGNTGDLEYKITNTEIYIEGVYYRIATADVLTDDSAYYTYVYLVDLEGNIKPIGHMVFYRKSSDVFFTPINILFYNGESQNGGGIFALVTVQNSWDESQRYYYIYEIDKDFKEWSRIYDYYVPTVYINGRGNLYDTARLQNGFSSPSPKTLESPNLLNGKFYAYYTSDGYSSSFRLPFSNLAEETVVCRVYYNTFEYVEWIIEPEWATDTKKFNDIDLAATIDRSKGILNFTYEGQDYPIQVMQKYCENNIRITAVKEIANGFSKVVYSTCSVKNNSKLFIAGGESGNTVFVTSYENPLYFPQGSSDTVGNADSEITALSVQKDKILAFKPYEIYALDISIGKNINEISLLRDNDKIFKYCDSIKVTQITNKLGCENKRSVAVCDNVNIWLGKDNCVYALESVSTQKIVNLSENILEKMPFYEVSSTFAVGNEKYYFLVCKNEVIVIDLSCGAIYLWKIPNEVFLQCGFYHKAKFRFLCSSRDTTVAYIATLDGEKDVYVYLDTNGEICQAEKKIENFITTKVFQMASFEQKMNIDNIYLSISAVDKAQIAVNSKEINTINFGFIGEAFNKHDYKSVRIVPHLHGVNGVFLTISSNDFLSIGEAEIYYRIIG
ncbi:MAG: hypothetical protein E7537_04495 [Ruminococcaceae bacterium]|nr:hypothetical protein [Oscillospiraceae bacterium]